MRLSSSFAALTLLACQVAAHSTFQQLWIGNVDAGSSCIRMPLNNNPIDVSSSALACNNASSSQGVCPIKAGDTLTVEMHAQPGQRSCSNEAIGGQHYGPVIVYMAKVDNAATASATSAGWFKVSEGGLMSNSPNWWAVQTLNANCGHWTFKVPSDLAAGDYLIRAEVIALHVAGSSGGAQFYPACFQVKLSGGGSANPPTVRFPGAYSPSDPGILVNIHQSLATYKIPGPTPYGSSPATVANTPYPTTASWNTAQQPLTVPTVVPGGGSPTSAGTTVINTTPTPTPTSGGGGGTVALYGQCGGNGYTGPTSCAQGKCTKINDYYSQCLP